MNKRKYELEITSKCNAGCPACHRTRNAGKFDIASITIDDFKKSFPGENEISGTQFLLCGALGDPVANKDCMAIVEHIVNNGGWAELNSNAGLQTVAWWKSLGELCKNTDRVYVWFCVDGHRQTNHIYRVGVDFDVIERNMNAYVEGCGGIGTRNNATWMFVRFDHNESELDLAKDHAEKLGFNFSTRTGVGNSSPKNVVIRKRDKETKELTIEEKTVVSSGDNTHSKVSEVKLLHKLAFNQIKNEDLKKQVVKSIKCKYVHENELFVASDNTLWPCCFLWSEQAKDPEIVKKKLEDFGPNWNSLSHHSIDEILEHNWYKKELEESWDSSHPRHFTRCTTACGFNRANANEITNISRAPDISRVTDDK